VNVENDQKALHLKRKRRCEGH